MANYMEDTLATGATSAEFMLIGNCDIWVSGLLAGSVKLQLRFPLSSTWRDVPDGSYTVDTMKTIFISESGVIFRLVGSGNTAGVYVRLARYINT
jgi:hypothetical protein